jgi:hypothetical protein
MDIFYIVFGDFPKDFLYFGFNFTGHDFIFCVFLSFGNLPNIKQTRSYWRIIYSQKYIKLEEVNVAHHEGETEVPHRTRFPGRMGPTCLPLVGPFVSFFDFTDAA